jgi:hypothetical protein
MTRETNPQALEKIALQLTADAAEVSPRSARGDNAGQIQSDLSFMSFLEEPAWMLKLSVSSNVLEESDESAALAEQKKAQEAKSEKAKEEKSASATEQSAAKTSAEATGDISKDYKDARDMLAIDARQLQLNDIKILQNLGQMPPVPLHNLNNFSQSLMNQLPQGYYKSLGVSKGLQELLESAYKTQRPIRIDLTDTASIILRMGKDGRVSAEFLPSDQAADLYFRQNLQELKSRLESKQLPYGELVVRDWKQRGNQQQQEQEKRK